MSWSVGRKRPDLPAELLSFGHRLFLKLEIVRLKASFFCV
jgi:hypothetical protein